MLMDKLLTYTKKVRNFKSIPRNIHTIFEPSTLDYSSLNVAFYANPCGGNGDVSFATRIWEYLYDWFGIAATVYTSRPSTFVSNGIIPKRLIYCVKDSRSRKPYDCIETNVVKVYNIDCKKRIKRLPLFDLYFVVPWVSEEIFTYKSLQGIFSNANAFNTYIFSAYNQESIDQSFDFITGIGSLKGESRLGMMFVDVPRKRFKYEFLKPYILVHISKTDEIDPEGCIRSFIKTMLKKYKYSVSFVLPKYFEKYPYLFKQIGIQLGVNIDLYITDVPVREYHYSDTNVVYSMRTDILPVPLDDFNSLIQNALPDYLMTGNQSVTDLISVKDSFSLYYQLMPWESSFSRQLAKLSGHTHLSNQRLSCGLGKISYKPVKWDKVKDFDFRKLAYGKIHQILEYVKEKRDNEYIQEYIDLYNGSRTKASFLKKLERISK